MSSAPVVVFKTPMDNMSKINPSTLMTHVACESMVPSVLRSSMHPCLGNLVAIRCVVVYYALDAHEFSAGIKCRHCKCGMLLCICQLGLGVEDNIWLGLPYAKIFTCLILCRLRVEGLRNCNMVMGDHIVISR